MATTLASVKSTAPAADTTVDMVPAGSIDRSMAVVAMPPGFVEAETRPVVYIGGENEGGLPFYTWNFDDQKKEYVPVNRFSAQLIGIDTRVKNADDEMKRSVKLVLEFKTSSGGRVAISCGAKTYSAIGIVSGLNAMTADQLAGEIGLFGKVGRNGVTFINTYADGQPVRDVNAEDLLKEARKDDGQIEAVQGYVGEIKAKLEQAQAPF